MYQRPFRIVQDLMVDPSPQGIAALTDTKTLTITGMLEYQACDDKVCFNPQSLPLSWTVSLTARDRQRIRQP